MNKFPRDYQDVRPKWLPDWTHADAYTDHGEDWQAWAWEYLRRNPKYQADYARWAANPDTDGEGSWSPKHELTFGDWVPMAFCYDDPPALSGEETAGEYERRTGVHTELLHLHYCRHWGISELMDPAKDSAPDYSPSDSDDVPPYGLSFVESYADYGRDTVFVGSYYEWMKGRLLVASWPADLDECVKSFAFDLRYNIDDQVDAIGVLLKEMQAEAESPPADFPFPTPPMKRVKRISAKGLPGMLEDLRILDATWFGADWRAIADKLWPPAKKSKTPDEGVMEKSHLRRYERAVENSLERSQARCLNGGYLKMMKWAGLPQSSRNKRRKSR